MAEFLKENQDNLTRLEAALHKKDTLTKSSRLFSGSGARKRGGLPRPFKISVADDSASDRMIINSMLSEYCILTACDGAKAMRVLKEHSGIGLLIPDLNMPNMNGFRVPEALKADDRYRKLRTIIVTNFMEYVSNGFYSLTGYPPESLIHNRDLSDNSLTAPEYREVLWNEWQQLLPSRKPMKMGPGDGAGS